jgi:hypothetical protein
VVLRHCFYQDYQLHQLAHYAYSPKEQPYHPRHRGRLPKLGLALHSRARHIKIEIRMGLDLEKSLARY